MPSSLWFDEEKLAKFARRIRERWPGSEILRVEQKRAKQVIYVHAAGGSIKLIVYRDGRVRAYGRPEGLALALKNIAKRVLGVGDA
jgi:hypothetical protein